MKNPTPSKPWSIRESIGVLAAVFALALIPAPFLLTGGQSEEKPAAAPVAPKAPPTATPTTKPKQRTKPMAQIAQGTTGPADFLDSLGVGATPGEWQIYSDILGTLTLVAYSAAPGDWDMTSGGAITVPADAQKVDYLALYTTSTSAPEEPGMFVADRFAFTVVEGGVIAPPVRTGAIINPQGHVEITFNKAVKALSGSTVLGFGARWLDCYNKTVENDGIVSATASGSVVTLELNAPAKIGEDWQDFYDAETGNLVSDDENEIPVVTYVLQEIDNQSDIYNSSMMQFL